MSWSLVNRGLDLFNEDELTSSSSNVKESSSRGVKGKGVNTNRHGIQRAAKHKKRLQQEQKELRNQLVQRKVTDAVKEYKKRLPGDNTKKNLKLLKRLDGKINASHAEKITKHHDKNLARRNKRRADKAQKKEGKAAEASVFTDEDFEKMNEIWLRLNN